MITLDNKRNRFVLVPNDKPLSGIFRAMIGIVTLLSARVNLAPMTSHNKYASYFVESFFMY